MALVESNPYLKPFKARPKRQASRHQNRILSGLCEGFRPLVWQEKGTRGGSSRLRRSREFLFRTGQGELKYKAVDRPSKK
jgi:hypothetical protein